MKLTNLSKLKDEIEYLEEAEELLQAIWISFDNYELYNKLKNNPCISKDLPSKLNRHFDFDDSE